MTESSDLSSQIEVIRAALLRFAGTKQTGAQLRALIDSACPKFDLRAAAGVPSGPGALTKLLLSRFPDIVHLIGKNGGDNFYHLGPPTAGLSTSNDSQPRGVNLWTAFASPDLGLDVVYTQANNSLSVQPRDTAISPDQVRITSISSDEFREIAESFVENAPLECRSELVQLLGEDEFVFHNWVSLLKRGPVGLYQDWGHFRVRKIIELFRNRLVSAGLPEEQIDKAVESLKTEQSIAFRLRAQAIDSIPEQRAPPTIQDVATDLDSDVSNARDIASLLIKYMSVSEIRKIAVPLGAIIDARLVPRK